jgi:hypothetical protein
MSTMPPADAAVLPWDERERKGILTALVETIVLFFKEPEEAWRRTREKGDFVGPLLFAALTTVVPAVSGAVYRRMFPPPWLRLLPPALAARAGRDIVPFPFAIGCVAILAPIAVAAGLYIGAAVLHGCFWLVGALKDSTSGFEGTFRMLAFSSVSSLANVVPLVGPLVAVVWGFYLNVKGAVRLHRTTPGRAVAALLIPGAVLIVVLLALLVALVAMLPQILQT